MRSHSIYEQFWSGFQKLVESCPLAVCNEPIVRTILRFDAPSDGCGKGTIRVTPKGDVLPCVFWPTRNLVLAELENLGAGNVKSPAFRELDRIPQFCGSCRFVESCRGGCPSRRLLRGGLDQPDEFCPFAAGKPLPSFASLAGSSRQFPKAGSACTTVFGAEEQGEPKG
jgi:radical SAM protein with 4Fe4S-binding SPASM domain